MRTFAFIFARGGSKGIPRKNLELLDGKPLLVWSIEMAQSLNEVEKVFVSTEDSEIAETAISFGAELIKRPKRLAQDSSPEWQAWRHAVRWVNNKYGEFDRFLSLPPTSPLRSQNDIRSCLHRFDDGTDVIITITPASRSPWYNMVYEELNGALKLLMEGDYTRRQDTPLAYDITTAAYVLKPSFILYNQRFWNGNVKGVKIPRERALDIDTQLDLEITRFIHEKYVKNR